MDLVYNINGLVHWTGPEISLRNQIQSKIVETVQDWLRNENNAWRFDQIEAPIMIPQKLINSNYTDDDLWTFNKHDEFEEALVARPETTPSTYAWMVKQMNGQNSVKFPWCVWQSGKSFRAEQDQVLKHMRLKEFYQLEFQCAYSEDTANDYHAKCLEPVRKLLGSCVGLPTRIVESDRLPSYSLTTMDIEVDTGDRWMEICSISKRNDFPAKNRYQAKNNVWKETNLFVLEIAIGLDRCVNAKSISDERI